MRNEKTVAAFGADIDAGRFGWFDVFIGWLRARHVRKTLLIDMLYDLSAIEVLYRKALAEDEDHLRNLLVAARDKKVVDENEIREISDRIAAHKSAVQIRQKTQDTIEEYRTYLAHLEAMRRA